MCRHYFVRYSLVSAGNFFRAEGYEWWNVQKEVHEISSKVNFKVIFHTKRTISLNAVCKECIYWTQTGLQSWYVDRIGTSNDYIFEHVEVYLGCIMRCIAPLKLFDPTLYWVYGYLSMLGLKLNHVSKRGPRSQMLRLSPSHRVRHLNLDFCLSLGGALWTMAGQYECDANAVIIGRAQVQLNYEPVTDFAPSVNVSCIVYTVLHNTPVLQLQKEITLKKYHNS